MSVSYKDAGVDIAAGEQAVKEIKNLVRQTFTPNVLTEIGLFGGCFAFPVKNYCQPVLVASTDGVGTKLIVANLLDRHNTVGQCLVNHCVNDILTTGARPLFFLDY
ncbi:MAG: phosphoribosylformylglycinamidine cyclo-ligase, partial [Candidatus Marinimicrobia bacterium]|nr:phosphoribosylformylglycinamidine cyclo-ligase [Candidatus Neomarinimicrobiota bacterium]